MAVGVTQVPVCVIAEDAFSAAGKRIIGYFWGDFWQEAIRVQLGNILLTIGTSKESTCIAQSAVIQRV